MRLPGGLMADRAKTAASRTRTVVADVSDARQCTARWQKDPHRPNVELLDLNRNSIYFVALGLIVPILSICPVDSMKVTSAYFVCIDFQVCSRVNTCWLVHLKSKKKKGCTGGPLCTVDAQPNQRKTPWLTFYLSKWACKLCVLGQHKKSIEHKPENQLQEAKKKNDSLQPTRNYLSINCEPGHIFPANVRPPRRNSVLSERLFSTFKQSFRQCLPHKANTIEQCLHHVTHSQYMIQLCEIIK